MYSQTIKWCAASGAIAFTALAAMQPGWAQDAQNPPSWTQRPTSEVDSPYAARAHTYFHLVHPGKPDAMAEIRKAAEELRDAKEDKEKQAAELQLRDLLLKYFAADMENRAKELDAMNRRLQKLNEQLQRRQEKMDDIIDLQMKVLANEADGLGFFSMAPTAFGAPTPSFQTPLRDPADPATNEAGWSDPYSRDRYPTPAGNMPMARPQEQPRTLQPAAVAPSAPVDGTVPTPVYEPDAALEVR